ncbi:polyketide cyclase [Chromatiales bacterium (ex Bugula neritina AB1)]|nr:polyketide cyclase [Chromatiales bacterium (ex Bugula neritina AB1)]
MNTACRNRQLLAELRLSQYNFEPDSVRAALNAVFSANAKIQLAFPFENPDGPDAFYNEAYKPLHTAVPDLERRDTIVIAGMPDNGSEWVGCVGYYTGTFTRPWLDIPATGHQVAMRYHEFYRIEDNQVVEFQGLWDIPEVMLQANAWPMAPSLGREWQVPGPATQDGIKGAAQEATVTTASCQLVLSMLSGLGEFSTGGTEAMRLEDYWHPSFSWYGPSGIGTARGIKGFRNWHQIPFLNAMPDRSAGAGNLFSEGEYVGYTAWPGMEMTLSGDGFLGIAPVNRKITMRSLDFWRCENGLIRENWVLVDLLDVYQQIGVDVFARLREFNKARCYPVV